MLFFTKKNSIIGLIDSRYDFPSLVSYYQGINIVKNGKTSQEQRFYVESLCDGRTFILDYAYPGNHGKSKNRLDMALNGSDSRYCVFCTSVPALSKN